MVFDKEEPQKLEYAVEVFSEGNENDTKPEPETEEFAGTVEAGWELVSSRKKLCIFRKLSQDAAPIINRRNGTEVSKRQRENPEEDGRFLSVPGAELAKFD